MKHFKKRAEIDGSRFITPILPVEGVVVDLGCGHGALASWVAQHNQQLQVIALDKELHKLTDKLPSTPANLSFIEADAYHLPLSNNSVDVIYLHAVCMYLNSTELVLAEAKRILKRGGKLALRNGLSVVNNMELFIDGNAFNKMLEYNLYKNSDNPKIAFKLTGYLEELNFSDIKSKTSIETSHSQQDIENVAQASIELLDGRIGKTALMDGIISKGEISEIKLGLNNWAKSNEAYNRAVWLEHLGIKSD